MFGALFSTRRRRIAIVIAVAILAGATIFAAAWLASPEPTLLQGRVQARLPSDSRPISLDAIAPIMREAVVATEDERFYRHDGIDLLGVTRALPDDLVHLSLAQGESTITEQVAKILYLGGSDRHPWRKLEDAMAAVRHEGSH